MEELSTKYKLKSRTIITSEYNQFLYKLYLPLIGPKAVFLYNFFATEYQYGDKNFTLKEAVKKSGLDLQDFLFERKMLESIGLISCFQEENKILIIINAILTPKNFFGDVVLKGLFVNAVGEKEALSIIKHYEIDDDIEGMTEITSSINDNFSINFNIDNLNVGEGIKLASTNKVPRVDSFSDVILLEYLKKKTNISETSISPDELKKIHDTGVLFDLDEKIMAQIIADAYELMNPFGERIDFSVVQRKAKAEVIAAKSYNRKHRKNDTNIEIDEDTDEASRIRYYQSMSPREFLRRKQDGVEPVSADLDLITYLSENMEFPYAVINVILDYALQNTDNQLSRKYVEKIAASLKRNRVSNVIEAIAALYKSKKKTAKELQNNDKIEEKKEEEIDTSLCNDLDGIF